MDIDFERFNERAMHEFRALVGKTILASVLLEKRVDPANGGVEFVAVRLKTPLRCTVLDGDPDRLGWTWRDDGDGLHSLLTYYPVQPLVESLHPAHGLDCEVDGIYYRSNYEKEAPSFSLLERA
jgi:hypothetical protein